MSQELLPCPFCKGKAYFERMGTGRQSCIVECESCGVRHESSDEYGQSGMSWNKRAQPAGEAVAAELPPMPQNVAHVTRRIRRCESDVPAQLVLEHFAREYARAAVANKSTPAAFTPKQIGTINELLLCFRAWEPQVRVLGNVRADDAADAMMAVLSNLLAAPPAAAQEAEKLAVWYGPMPESNGKSNFTAILHRGSIFDGITIDRSEYPDRVRYEADRMRWMIGEIADEPDIMAYDSEKHSGYVAAPPAAANQAGIPEGERIALLRLADRIEHANEKAIPISISAADIIRRLVAAPHPTESHALGGGEQ